MDQEELSMGARRTNLAKEIGETAHLLLQKRIKYSQLQLAQKCVQRREIARRQRYEQPFPR